MARELQSSGQPGRCGHRSSSVLVIADRRPPTQCDDAAVEISDWCARLSSNVQARAQRNRSRRPGLTGMADGFNRAVAADQPSYVSAPQPWVQREGHSHRRSMLWGAAPCAGRTGLGAGEHRRCQIARHVKPAARSGYSSCTSPTMTRRAPGVSMTRPRAGSTALVNQDQVLLPSACRSVVSSAMRRMD